MPTILRIGPYRFYFYSHEPGEPLHVHIDKGDATAKVWHEQVAVARHIRFRSHELNVILGHVRANRELLLEAWDGYFSDRG